MPTVNPRIHQRQYAASPTGAQPPPLNVTSLNNPTTGAAGPAVRPGNGASVPFQPAQPIVAVDPSDRTTWPAATGMAFSPTPSVAGA